MTSRLGTVKLIIFIQCTYPLLYFNLKLSPGKLSHFQQYLSTFGSNSVSLGAEVTTTRGEAAYASKLFINTLCSYRISGWRPSVTAKTGRRATTATPGLIPTLQENMEPMDLEVSHGYFSLASVAFTHHRGWSQKWTCLPSRKCKDGLKFFNLITQ